MTVTLGFDGSRSDDHTALVGCSVEDDHAFLIEAWAPPKDGEIDRADVDRVVRDAISRYSPVGFYADVKEWESYIDSWSSEFGDELVLSASPKSAVGWDMRTREREFTRACERTLAAIVASAQAAGEGKPRGFTHDGSATLRWYALNARRNPNRYGISVRKEHRASSKKIDAVPALILARLARLDWLALPESKRRRRGGRVW